MSDKYAAFISYAHRDKPWVQALQRNLERCLAAAGRPGKVFLDEVDLASGRSWVGQLQAGLDRSEQLILVATPESMASPRVADEWRSFVASRPDWHLGRFHIVHLVDVPFPSFLGQIQPVDFRNAGEDRYRRELQKLTAGLLGQADGRNLPALPTDIEIPPPPTGRLDPALRSQLVDWLSPVLAKRVYRLALAPALGVKPEQLENQGSWDCAASAALVWASGQEEPVTAALRILDTLQETLGEDEPERVADLAPLREKLEAHRSETPDRNLLSIWLQYVANDNQHLFPLQEHVALTPLDAVYVHLALSPRRSSDPDDLPRLEQPPTFHEPLADRLEHPWLTTGRWVVLGDPGAGKTTLLRHLAATLARQEDPPWVPLLDSLPRLLLDHSGLLDRVVRRLERTGQPVQGLKEALNRTGQAGRLLLLFDGLDEVPKKKREDAEQFLRDLTVRWPYSPLIVTSRPIGYRPPGIGFLEITLLPLDRDRRHKLLASWFGRASGTPDEKKADSALQALDAPDLWELAGNPLYLTLMALLFEQGITPDRNRNRLYDQVFDLLLEGKHRPTAEPIERKDTVRELLRRIAFDMTKENKDAESISDLENHLYRPTLKDLRKELEKVRRWKGHLRRFLDELAEKTAILGPHDGRATDWRFWHRTFQEALTAEKLADQSRKGGRAAVLSQAQSITTEEDLSRWAEPFALLAGMVQDSDDLVKALVHENRPLGLRALATAQSLRTETVREVLALSEDWRERAKIYRRLPELVGEPRRALALIRQLRRQTYNGNDLYFLDSAAREIGSLFPEHSEEIDFSLENFFDHIPRPPEELFQWAEVPFDGRLALWREIPAGSFWQGGLEDEAYDDELPRHRVTITAPFRLGIIPITNAQYAAFDQAHQPLDFGVPPDELPHHPVEHITWFEALSFCRWLSASFPWARGARLPIEAEWEYACRAGSQSKFWNGNQAADLAAVGWYRENSESRTHRVGEKPANPWGLYDVHGNVWEWTLSRWTPGYEGREGGVSIAPKLVEIPFAEPPLLGGRRVLRGGNFRMVSDGARAACREHWEPGSANDGWGFRVVLP